MTNTKSRATAKLIMLVAISAARIACMVISWIAKTRRCMKNRITNWIRTGRYNKIKTDSRDNRNENKENIRNANKNKNMNATARTTDRGVNPAKSKNKSVATNLLANVSTSLSKNVLTRPPTSGPTSISTNISTHVLNMAIEYSDVFDSTKGYPGKGPMQPDYNTERE